MHVDPGSTRVSQHYATHAPRLRVSDSLCHGLHIGTGDHRHPPGKLPHDLFLIAICRDRQGGRHGLVQQAKLLDPQQVVPLQEFRAFCRG